MIKIPSEKNPDLYYLVNLDTGECTCPYFTLKLRPENEQTGSKLRCKHYVQALTQSTR
jgi:hypothetical protein